MLAPGEVNEFLEQGYLVVRRFFSAAQVITMHGAFDRLERLAERLGSTQQVNGALFVLQELKVRPLGIERIVWCGAAEPELGELGRTPRLLSAMAQLLGTTELDQLINQAHIKRPGDGVGFPFHQDSYHRRYETPLFRDVNGRGSFVQSLTAVDKMGPENGGLWLVPKSQKLGHLHTETGELPDTAFDKSKAVPVRLGPGDVLLLSPFTIHGSEPNESRVPRRVFINGFCCAGANQRLYPGAGTGLRLSVPSLTDAPATYATVV